MAETKNSFLRGKMNKDLDDRLLPNGEYRDALNISVGKSEDKSVGSLQNVLGNSLLTMPGPSGTVPFETNDGLVCIGILEDNENARVFQFLTDYTDPSPSNINLPTGTTEMKITVYNASNNASPYVTLVSGDFLNFSTTNLITGVNLIENLLFWTDNRNQPRKINVDSALNNPATSTTPYYTKVEQIAVAKYAPFKAPTLYEEVSITTTADASMLSLGQTIIKVPSPNTLTIGDQLVNEDIPVNAGDFSVIIKKGIPSLGVQQIYLAGNYVIPASTPLTFYRTTMTSSSSDSNINGNDNFLIDKFVRFSYRFKFDDNEYSLMAPFTQPIFIPLQKGYFTSGDEEAAYASTVLEWMQNAANGVRLNIEMPDIGNNILSSYKIKSIDILYKESDSLAVKVVETIPIIVVQQTSPTTSLYTYTYNSQKPKKTLQEAEIVRVYDKVPIRALAQESAGNRIMYGNFVNQSTPPANLNYNIQVLEKNTPRTSWYEYPNHTLKQNRTYQVGVILADKFGRQSSVILSNASPFAAIEDIVFGASSVFFPYKNDSWDIPVKNWLGDVLSITFNSTITSVRDENLYTPGLYANVSGSIPNSSNGFQILSSTIIGNLYEFVLAEALPPFPPPGTTDPQRNYPDVGNFLKGKYTDYVEVTAVTFDPLIPDIITVTTSGPISDLYAYNPVNDPDIKYSYSINELGWYSYKIVVKQTEQDYYNVYTPGMLAGYPINQTFKIDGTQIDYTIFPPNEEDTTCHFVLINDNINKVPRDLSEVGPNQRQYRSSVRLWGRVENVLLNPMSVDPAPITTNRQYYPGTTPDIVSTIAPTTDLDFIATSLQNNPLGSAEFNLYQFNTSPLVARVSTVNQVGVVGNYVPSTTPTDPSSDRSMSPFLGVYETDATESLLDIFWETSTSDYISNLNWDINVGSNGVVGFSAITFLYNEDQPINEDDWIFDTGTIDSSWITDPFWFINSSGVIVDEIDSVLFQVLDRDGTNVTTNFDLVEGPLLGDGFFRIKIVNNNFFFGSDVENTGSFKFRFFVTNTVSPDTYTVDLNTDAYIFKISNSAPSITIPTADDLIYFVPINQPSETGNILIDSVGKNGNSSTGTAYNAAELFWTLASTIPVSDFSFSIDSNTGNIRLSNSTPTEGITTFNIGLRDSTDLDGFSSPAPNPLFPSQGSLSTNLTVNFEVENRKVWCSNWNTLWIAGGGGYRLNSSGEINIWRMLKPGEEIVGCTLQLRAYRQQGEVGFTTVTNPTTLIIDETTVGRLTWPVAVNLKFVPTGTSISWVEELRFTGTITVNGPGGTRVINETFDSIGRVGSGTYTSISQECIYFPDDVVGPVPTPYTPEWCADWEITNISTSTPIYWLGLANDANEIIGNVLPAGASVSSSVLPGGYPKVRIGSLRATGQGGVLSDITYGLSVSC
jgi:hypothetical protein